MLVGRLFACSLGIVWVRVLGDFVPSLGWGVSCVYDLLVFGSWGDGEACCGFSWLVGCVCSLSFFCRWVVYVLLLCVCVYFSLGILLSFCVLSS